ncbi:MAG: glycosyltransferase family 1 protein, partial [Anaerolineae bacterium]
EGTSLPEAGGRGALAVEGNNVEAVTCGLQRMLVDEEFRADLRRQGLKHATCFDWGETARQTTTLYRNILASQG